MGAIFFQISASKYLPFLNGENILCYKEHFQIIIIILFYFFFYYFAGFDAINRTMVGVDTVTSVHISSYKKDKPNFDKSQVYVSYYLKMYIGTFPVWVLDMMRCIREPALLLIKQCIHCVMILNKLQINLRLPNTAPDGSITPKPQDVRLIWKI